MPKIKKVDKNFFKKWGREVAYVLGFFFADGNLTITKRGTYFFSFYSADKVILQRIKKALDSTHKLSLRKSPTGSLYRVQIGSKEMVNDLIQIGAETNKTKRMSLPDIPQYLFEDFLRGYFDGDGNVWSGLVNRKRNKSTSVLQLSLTSSCRPFLENLHKEINRLGIRGGSLFLIKNKHCFRLTFSTHDALKLAEIMYNKPHELYLRRKKLVFERFLRS